MFHVLVTGARGQLGHDVVLELKRRDISCRGVDIEDFDLTDEQAVEDAVLAEKPQAVIHCAAYTAVDKAEDEPERCFKINVTGTANLARACRALNAKMMYISTDYVFGGEGTEPYAVDAPREPKSQYGRTKSEGEDQVRAFLDNWFIVRIAWVFGINGHNFVKTMLRLGREKPQLSVVADQIGSPTYTADLAVLLADMIITDRYGVYHATNEGYCSWYDFACAILRQAGITTPVQPVPSSSYPTKAVRPMNSRLDKTSLDVAGFNRLPSWQDALSRFLHTLAEHEKDRLAR